MEMMLDRLKTIQSLLTSLADEPYYNKHMSLLRSDNNYKEIHKLLNEMVEEMDDNTIKKFVLPDL